MPSLLNYVEKTKKLPECITASFAFYIQFYRGFEIVENGMLAKRKENEYIVKDSKEVLDFFFDRKDMDTKTLVHDVLRNEAFWGEDLSKIDGFEEAVIKNMEIIETEGAYALMKQRNKD